jgi:hypothetical protein
MMQPSETVRVEKTVSGNVILAINEMDRSHWMLQNVEILIQAFFNTPMVPYMYHTTVLLPILLQLTTFSPLKHPFVTNERWIIQSKFGSQWQHPFFAQLPPQACHIHVVPGLAFMSLLAMGPLCDARCMIEFDTTTVHLWLQEQLLLQGSHAPPGLWIFQLPTSDTTMPLTNNAITTQVNSAIRAPKAAELVAYAHATLFSPALDTLEKALHHSYVHNFPRLTAKMLQCHLPHSVVTDCSDSQLLR